MSLLAPTRVFSDTIDSHSTLLPHFRYSKGRWTGVCVYIDDILITGSNDEEHLEHLDEVLCRLAETGMRLKPAKCAYLLPSVDYLGHTICAEGLYTSDAKVSGIVEAPAP